MVCAWIPSNEKEKTEEFLDLTGQQVLMNLQIQ